jgi:hypothetical protein
MRACAKVLRLRRVPQSVAWCTRIRRRGFPAAGSSCLSGFHYTQVRPPDARCCCRRASRSPATSNSQSIFECGRVAPRPWCRVVLGGGGSACPRGQRFSLRSGVENVPVVSGSARQASGGQAAPHAARAALHPRWSRPCTPSLGSRAHARRAGRRKEQRAARREALAAWKQGRTASAGSSNDQIAARACAPVAERRPGRAGTTGSQRESGRLAKGGAKACAHPEGRRASGKRLRAGRRSSAWPARRFRH